jgi:FlaA1/EpsC-like NDP-sugar epimerase
MRKKSYFAVRALRRLTRRSKQLLMILADLIAIPSALWTAAWLRTGSFDFPYERMTPLAMAALLATIPIFAWLGLYRAVVRFLGLHAAILIGIGVAFSALVLFGVNSAIEAPLPPETFAVYFAIATLYVCASRFGAREFLR